MRTMIRLATTVSVCCLWVAAHADPLVPLAPDKPREPSPHALAMRARWVTVPGWTLDPYLDQHTALDGGWSVGLEYLYRRSGFDVVISVDYSWLNPPNGNFLGKGNRPEDETHYLNFSGLSSLSADVSLIGHWNVLPWLEIRAGGGLGLGGVLGEIHMITNNSGCTAENAGDPSRCYPRRGPVSNIGPLDPNSPQTVELLERNACPGGDGRLDTPQSPCYRRVDTYPMNVRIVPVINTLLGLRFRAHPHVYVHLEAGWRLVGFYLGAGPEFRF
ncbi:MAG: hypothetical protein RMK29_07840 [Myxococcales bacterium]|nr:hypothetical protein [Myxococcota bacterium]MDW8281605.1 hypothetical protein [Myxococcales bacterium]